jgi:hypothetical protein
MEKIIERKLILFIKNYSAIFILVKFKEHERFVNVVRYSPNGEKFASGGADGKV